MSFIDVRVAELCFSIKKEIFSKKKETQFFLGYIYFKTFSTNYYDNSINLNTDCARFKMLTYIHPLSVEGKYENTKEVNR
jgi:hypothetical protein